MKTAKKKPQTAELAPPALPAPDQPQQPVDWVSDRDLAERTPISRMGWQNWRARRLGPPYYKVGKRVLYKWGEVLAWLESKRTEPKAS